jgi:hypothetical protein
MSQVAMVFDEGGSIGADGYAPYSPRPLALVGTAEKGFATYLAQVRSVMAGGEVLGGRERDRLRGRSVTGGQAGVREIRSPLLPPRASTLALPLPLPPFHQSLTPFPSTLSPCQPPPFTRPPPS